jgi:hypothetical protein
MSRSTYFRTSTFGTDPRRAGFRAIGVQQQMQPVNPPPKEGEEDNGGEDDEDAKPVTKGELAKMLGQTVNSAVTSQLKRLDFKKMIGDAIAPVLEGLKPAPKGDDEEEDKGGKGKAPEKDGAVLKLQRELETMKADAKKAQDEAAAEKKAARIEKVETTVRSLLGSRVRPEVLDLTVSALRARGALVVDDEGNASFRLPFAASKGAKPELTDFSLEDGVAEFLKTPEAAALVPAPNNGGSGAPARPRGPAGRPGSFDMSTKPIEKWTPADRENAFQQNLERLAEKNKGNVLG